MKACFVQQVIAGALMYTVALLRLKSCCDLIQ